MGKRRLVAGPEKLLGIVPCDGKDRWLEVPGRGQVSLVGTELCVDAGVDSSNPMLFPCHESVTSPSQRFHFVETQGWLQTEPSWSDNGRQRTFERCLDFSPKNNVEVVVEPCETSEKAGVRWTRTSVQVPLETRLWREAKPNSLSLGSA